MNHYITLLCFLTIATIVILSARAFWTLWTGARRPSVQRPWTREDMGFGGPWE